MKVPTKIIKLISQVVFNVFTALTAISVGTAALAEPYIPPVGIGAPGRRSGAGTRGCVFGNPGRLTVLTPTQNLGWTTAAYPRFYWYLPVNQASFVEFTLEKVTESNIDATMPESLTQIYSTRFAVTGEAGIMSLALPETASMPPLQVGDRYRWRVAIFCNPNSENGDIQAEGWVERHQPSTDLQAALETASESEQAGLYATEGYWYDAIAQFAALRTETPENFDLFIRWTELLESVDLETLAEQPIAAGD